MKTIICSFLLGFCSQVKAEDSYKTFVMKVINSCKTNFSEAKKELIADKVMNISNKYIETKEGRESFAVVIAIESCFKDGQTSKAGAKGLAQLMPDYFSDFAKECGLNVKIEDINDSDVNMAVGACHFNTLVKSENNPFIAIAAYNSGANSKTIQKLKKGDTKINKETDNYIKKYKKIMEKTKKE